jgi:hypothetical protein
MSVAKFGGLAISRSETHDFASRPHDRFALSDGEMGWLSRANPASSYPAIKYISQKWHIVKKNENGRFRRRHFRSRLPLATLPALLFSGGIRITSRVVSRSNTCIRNNSTCPRRFAASALPVVAFSFW